MSAGKGMLPARGRNMKKWNESRYFWRSHCCNAKVTEEQAKEKNHNGEVVKIEQLRCTECKEVCHIK